MAVVRGVVTVRTTLSGAPAGMSASISKVTITFEPTSPARWVITSSAILLASRPTRAGSRTTVAEQGFSGLYQAAKREPKNYKEGYFWLYLAATKDGSTEKDRDEIAAKLSAVERVEVKERAEKWLVEHRRK
jgi:hypothetical protein